MKYLIALGITLAVPVAAWPQQTEAGHRLYLLAASPTIYGPVTYPADLYTIGENYHLQLVRHVVPAEDGVDFVLSFSNALVVAHPHISPTAFEIIHYDDPGSVDTVTPNLGQRSVMDGFIVNPPGQTMIALDLSSSTEQTQLKVSLVGIDLRKSDSGQRVTDPLPWDNVGYARAEGEPGGALEGRSPHLAGTFTKDGWIRNTPQGPVLLAPHSSALPAALEGHVAALRCANDRFSVFSVNAGSSAETASSAIISDRQTGTSRAFAIPGNQSRFRLFGAWLTVLVVEPSTGHPTSPGSELQRKKATATLPSVAGSYSDAMRVEGKWLPGNLELINMDSGVVIHLNTGQSDSEILAVSGDQVLYRVNYQIFTASLSGDQLGKNALVAEDENIPEVHWAFWSAK